MNLESIKKEIFNINSEEKFEELCMNIFVYQANNNKIYKEYISLIDKKVEDITSLQSIPFLPIRFFKSKEIVCGSAPYELLFTSSATTGMIPSKHYVQEGIIYEKSFIEGFRRVYGEPSKYAIVALLPSYLEREGSSLVYMADKLIKMSGKASSGFYLYNHKELYDILTSLNERGEETILFGVSFALLDFISEYKIDFPSLKIIETGGMKGRGVELSREVLHDKLGKGFGVEQVHSEYGMAELLSQAYSTEIGVFNPPPWMKIVIRDLYNPFKYYNTNINSPLGGINIIDLANINSCAFIETEDMGRAFADGSFTVDGRIKDSELRGCNMLLENR